jgi:hypothetical protein
MCLAIPGQIVEMVDEANRLARLALAADHLLYGLILSEMRRRPQA